MILPSKKVLSIFIITAALVVAIIITFGKDKSSTAINFASDLVAGEKLTIPENQNWQNELVGVVPGANQAIAEEEDSSENGVTDTVATTLISNYLALKQNNSLTAESAQKLIDQTINYIEKSDIQLVKATELKVIADNGKISISQYGENLGNILRNNKPKTVRNELEIITQIAKSGDSSIINELDSVIATYKKIADELTKMPVPKTFVWAHLDMINSSKGIVAALTEAKTVFNDPINSLPAIKLYQEGATILIQARQAINAYIIKNNIVYKQGTGGYYLLYGI